MRLGALKFVKEKLHNGLIHLQTLRGLHGTAQRECHDTRILLSHTSEEGVCLRIGMKHHAVSKVNLKLGVKRIYVNLPSITTYSNEVEESESPDE